MTNDHVKSSKALKGMAQKGLNGLIVYSNGTCQIVRPNYLHYFSEFKPMGSRNAAILSRSGERVLLVEPEWDSPRAKKKSWIRDTRGTSHFLKDLKGILGEFKIKGPVGVAGLKEMTQEVYAFLRKEIQIQPADELIEEIALEKSARELEIVRKAAGIADLGFEAFLEHAREGVREYELAAEMEFAMRAAGAEDVFDLLDSGKHSHGMHSPTDRKLKKGDLVLAEITPVCEGQVIQLCRTVVLGRPSETVVEKYNMLLRSLEESLKPMKAGVPASVIAVAMNNVLRDAGYGDYCNPPYMRTRGHGFGVGSVAPGAEIDEDMKVSLERDQVIVVHPNQYLPETGYLACGETVLVTDTGIERLARTEAKLYIKER